MNDATPETYIFPVPGTDRTEELPRSTVLARMAKGEITPQHWVWSPPDQDWKQVSEIPSLRAAVPVASAPPAAGSNKTSLPGPLTQKKIAPAAAPARKKVVRPRREKRAKGEKGDFSILEFLAGLVLVAVAAVIALNYQFIDRPFDGNLAQTRFVLVQTHMHLGAFVQPDTVVIHVLPAVQIKTNDLPNAVQIIPNPELHAADFADFLFTLAKSTPAPPFGWKPFAVIEITPLLKGQYAFVGADWRQLARMDKSSSEERKQFVLDHVDDSSGHPLVDTKNLDSDAAQAAKDRVWSQLLASFNTSDGNSPDPGAVSQVAPSSAKPQGLSTKVATLGNRLNGPRS